jgi:hypothetical protein
MSRGLTYLVFLFLFSFLLFVCLTKVLGGTNEPVISFLLTLLTTHFILDKNEWIVDQFDSNEAEEEKE